MTIRRLHSSTPHPILRQWVADLLFGSPGAQELRRLAEWDLGDSGRAHELRRELPPGMTPPSVLKLPPNMKRPMVLRIAGEDPKTGRAYYGLRRLTWVQRYVIRKVVDFNTERFRSGRGFKYPVVIVYDYGASRYVLCEGYNRNYAAIQKGYDYVLGNWKIADG